MASLLSPGSIHSHKKVVLLTTLLDDKETPVTQRDVILLT